MFLSDHLVRFLVDWYQRNERETHSSMVPPPPPEGLPKFCISPSESLINSTAIIPKLVSEGKADIIIDTLRAYSQLPYVDKEAVVSKIFCKLYVNVYEVMIVLQSRYLFNCENN